MSLVTCSDGLFRESLRKVALVGSMAIDLVDANGSRALAKGAWESQTALASDGWGAAFGGNFRGRTYDIRRFERSTLCPLTRAMSRFSGEDRSTACVTLGCTKRRLAIGLEPIDGA